MFATLSAVISTLAFAVSVFVFIDNRRRAVETARLQRRPALVFAWNPEEQYWELNNIGNGPALDVVVLQGAGDSWTLPLRMPELAVGGDAVIPRRWLEQRFSDPALAARYRSVTGEPYMTETRSDVSTMSEGWERLPMDVWDNIEPHWRYRHRGAIA